MREKLRMATFGVLLVVVWGVGFLWFRGDLSFSTAGEPKAKSTDEPSASASASPSASPTVVPKAGPSYKGKVTKRQERQPVDLNPAAPRPRPMALPPIARFNVASFNLLGSSHTGPGGHTPRLASGPKRLSGALRILAQHQVSVVGFQEFQPNQRAAFRSRASGWQMYPGLSMGRRAGENSVAWRTDTWEMVKPGLIPIPYFNGRIRPMPYVLLRNKQTGVQAYFSTFHNPANIGGNQARHRREATRRQIRLFNQLESTKTPQFVTGDMNERGEYFCRVTGGTPLTAAAGGSNSGGCRPPKRAQIDWIFGSPGVQWTRYVVDRSPLVRRTTDHPVIVASVTVDALRFDNAYDPNAPITPTTG